MKPSEYKDELKFRVLWVLGGKQRDFSILLMLAAILLSLGFIFGTGTTANYDLIYRFGGNIFWAVFFAIYATIRFIDQILNIPRWLCIICGTLGIWAWNYIFLSFVVFDLTPVTPTEFLLLVPTIAEFWLLLAVTNKKS
jgi:hypothetical protein